MKYLKFKKVAMRQKIESHYVGDCLSLTVVGNGAILKVKGSRDNNGIDVANDLIKAMRNVDVTRVSSITVKVAVPMSLQFLSMYLVAPPGADFGRRMGGNLEKGTNKVIVFHLSGEAAQQLADLACNSSPFSVATLPEILGFLIRYETHGSEMPIDEVHTFQGMRPTLQESIDDTCDLLSTVQPGFRDDWVEHHGALGEYFENSVQYDLRAEDFQGMPVPIGPVLEADLKIPKEHVRGVMEEDKTLHVQTDQTTHMFMLEDNGVASPVLVDCGNPASADYIKELLMHTNASRVIINLTHLHSDHAGKNLVKTIKAITDTGRQVILNGARTATRQWFGFISSNIEELLPLLEEGKIKLNFLDVDGKFIELTTSSQIALLSSPAAIGHYIVSIGYVIKDNSIGKVRIFSGDINPGVFNPATKGPYTPEEVKSSLVAYFDSLIAKALEGRAKGPKQIDFFFDYGHFPANVYEEFFRKYISEKTSELRRDGITINFYQDHIKSSEYEIRID